MEEKNLMSWLKKTNGWQRFWIAVTFIYAVLTLVILNVNIADFESFAVFLMWFVFPVTIFFVALYVLTFGIKWLRKRFKG